MHDIYGHISETLCIVIICDSYSALSVQYDSNTARGPRALCALGPHAVFEAISHTKRTITIIYSITMAP